VHVAVILGKILVVQMLDLFKVNLQLRLQPPVFHQAQAAAIKQFGHEKVGAAYEGQYALDFALGHDHGHPAVPSGPDRRDFALDGFEQNVAI
jgi:hypothetical protein